VGYPAIIRVQKRIFLTNSITAVRLEKSSLFAKTYRDTSRNRELLGRVLNKCGCIGFSGFCRGVKFLESNAVGFFACFLKFKRRRV